MIFVCLHSISSCILFHVVCLLSKMENPGDEEIIIPVCNFVLDISNKLLSCSYRWSSLSICSLVQTTTLLFTPLFPAMLNIYHALTTCLYLLMLLWTSWPQTRISYWSWKCLYIIEQALSQRVYHATSWNLHDIE